MKFWVVIILAVVGLLDVGYIYYKKNFNQKLVCVIGKDCNAVLNSKYSHILGLPMEVWGAVYYFVVLTLALLILLGLIEAGGLNIELVLRIITSLAALGSVGLIFIQLVVIKEWCEYCLLSAAVNFLLVIAIL